MVEIKLERDGLLSEMAHKMLRNRYMLPEEKSPQEAFARAAEFVSDSPAMAQRIYDYASQLWFMFATPILSNGGTSRGLPISCFLNRVDDSRVGISSHWDENIWLSSNGGGIGGYWGDLRSSGQATSRGSRSTGVIPFIKVVDSQMLAVSQGTTRRGSYAAYLPINHPEIIEFLGIRKPHGGDHNRKCLNLHHGVVISDEFMEIIEACQGNPSYDDSFELVDPSSKKVVEVVSAKKVWTKILETRMESGEPYIMFGDTVQRGRPEVYTELGLDVVQSNLCSEIVLHTSETSTAVCVLSSVNLEKFDEWESCPLFIWDLVRMLDNVVDKFVDSAYLESGLSKAVRSVKNERSLGLGTMGFHAYLQSKGIPLDGPMSVGVNEFLYKHIRTRAMEEERLLTNIRGECPLSEKARLQNDSIVPRRNLHLLAIAPNASSSLICGWTSPSVEPYRANVYTHKIIDGSYIFKNKYLQKLLSTKGMDTEEVWLDIASHKGSVQHLEFLDDYEKDCFKTAIEINQSSIVTLAGNRQKHICQAQSINLFFTPDVQVKELHDVHMQAWKSGLKTLYYCRSESIARPESLNNRVEVRAREEVDDCVMCEG